MTAKSKLLGQSAAFLRFVEMLERAASTEIPVLILGESGTGKELAARSLHLASARARAPFVPVDLSAVPPALIEDELFGHVPGAFTGAADGRRGKFRRAEGGTLFLDEIGDVPLGAQVKLLRALEAGVIEPLGSEEEVKVNVRIVAATHRNVHALVESGGFRSDLLYRLAVLPLSIPPLRERNGDVELLAMAFAKREVEGLAPVGLAAGALARLSAYSWPGNVRELENALMRARALATTWELSEADFDFLNAGAPDRARELANEALRHGVTMGQLEAALFEEAVRAARGNEAQAARRLGVTRRSVEYRLSKSREQ